MKYSITILKNMAIVTALLVVAACAIPGVGFAVGADPRAKLCEGAGGAASAENCAGQAGAPTVMGTIQNITNILIFVLGAVAVIMLIIGGIRYVTSAGDQNALTSAKNTVLYALIGVAVAIMAYAIVNFVLTNL